MGAPGCASVSGGGMDVRRPDAASAPKRCCARTMCRLYVPLSISRQMRCQCDWNVLYR